MSELEPLTIVLVGLLFGAVFVVLAWIYEALREHDRDR